MATYIIAEAGVNHNGNLENAIALVRAAKLAGADAVKFQTFKTENLVTTHANLADYQSVESKGSIKNQYELLKSLELSYDQFKQLKKFCDEMRIDFLSTAFDDESIDFLYSIDVPRWKIPSGEIDNLPYLMKIAALNKPVIISTGMSTLEEIRNAVNVFRDFKSSISILHCTSEYPAPFDEINLRAIQTLKSEFKVEVGYSDHTLGIEVPMAAVALGASIIEKHFTLDRNLSGPDHKASLEPEELKKMIMGIRNIELAMGDGIKKPTASEVKNKSLVRKSIVAKKAISKGEKLTDENLTLKRPGTGISPMLWFEILGKIAHKDYHEDEIIEL